MSVDPPEWVRLRPDIAQWGALDENEPSMKLAAKLGFRPAATLTSFVWP